MFTVFLHIKSSKKAYMHTCISLYVCRSITVILFSFSCIMLTADEVFPVKPSSTKHDYWEISLGTQDNFLKPDARLFTRLSL